MTSPIVSDTVSLHSRVSILEINRQRPDSVVRTQTPVRKTLNDTREGLYKSLDAGATAGPLLLRFWLGSACRLGRLKAFLPAAVAGPVLSAPSSLAPDMT